MKKILLGVLTLFAFTTSFAKETNSSFLVVDFEKCFEKSKVGAAKTKELKDLGEKLNSQMEEAQKKYKDLDTKLADNNYLDSISPEEEANLKKEKETLQQQLGMYQMQFQEMFNQAQNKMFHDIAQYVNGAAKVVAGQKNSQLVVNKQTTFYYDPSLDYTDLVIDQMDKDFEKESKTEAAKESK